MTQESRAARAAALEREAKALRRAEADFFKEADEREEELLRRWGLEKSTNRFGSGSGSEEGGSKGGAVGGGMAPRRPF